MVEDKRDLLLKAMLAEGYNVLQVYTYQPRRYHI